MSTPRPRVGKTTTASISIFFRQTPEQRKRALAEAGIPLKFADALDEISKAYGACFSFRMGANWYLYEDESAPKPSSIKAKTSNSPFTKGVIPVNSKLFGKIEGNTIREHKEGKDVPLDQPTVQHKLSLMEVAAGLKNGIYKQVDSSNPDELHIQAITNVAELKDVIVTIKLKSDPSLDTKQTDPGWWKPTWGNFNEKAKHRYPLYYQASPEAKSEALMVYGITDPNNKTIPITGDQDLLWITRPHDLTARKGFPKGATTVLDTYDPSGLEKMESMIWNLDVYFGETLGKDKKLFSKIENIPRETLHRMGCLTPYEAYMILAVNQKTLVHITHVKDFIQHGAENRNPGTPSNIDARMVHFYNGEVIPTANEEKLVEFVCKEGYVKQNIIDVHPKWNMELWAKVVKKQLESHYPVNKDTFKAYNEHMNKATVTATPAVTESVNNRSEAYQAPKPKFRGT